MRILFIDHEFHKKTHSADFFLKILHKAFDVSVHYYHRHYEIGAGKSMAERDVAVVWEFPVSRNRFFFPGKRNVFVPMYDNEWGSYWQWKRIAWSGMGVISFCDKVTVHARRCGVTNLLDVRYFPDPTALPHDPGDPKKVFLWERGEISRQVAEVLFPPSEGYSFVVKGANDFLPRDQYLELIASCGIVIAPRRKEGIGMAFLEAMAMGKCVVANNDATMNEYIEDGVTGVLFDSRRPQRVESSVIDAVRAKVPRAATSYRERWLNASKRINDFVAAQSVCRLDICSRMKLMMSYPLYLIEGALVRLR